VRALQTASLIADQINLTPSIDPYLVEIKRPRSLVGYKHHSIRSLFFYLRWYFGLVRTGETYRDLRFRIAAAKANIEQLPPDAVVVVVSHSVFIKMFLIHVCFNRAMNPFQAMMVFMTLSKLKNTETVEFTYTPIKKGCGWVQTNDLNLL
jgi:broad specificity phosphatase PhoE